MKFAFSVTFSAQSCRNTCPYKASWPSCAASDCTYQATAELEYGADVTAPTLTDPVPGRIFPNCMLLIVMPFLPANQRVWRETRAEDEPSELCASTD